MKINTEICFHMNVYEYAISRMLVLMVAGFYEIDSPILCFTSVGESRPAHYEPTKVNRERRVISKSCREAKASGVSGDKKLLVADSP